MKSNTLFLLSVCWLLVPVVCLSQEATQRTITGVVYDSSPSDVLIGATVLLRNTAITTLTDINGRFEIDVPLDRRVKLVVSYTGPPIEISVRKNKSYYEIDISRFRSKSRRGARF